MFKIYTLFFFAGCFCKQSKNKKSLVKKKPWKKMLPLNVTKRESKFRRKVFCLVQAKTEEPANCIRADAGLPGKLSHL